MDYLVKPVPNNTDTVVVNAFSDLNEWMDFDFTVPAVSADIAVSAMSSAEKKWWEDDEGFGILDVLEMALEEANIPYTVGPDKYVWDEDEMCYVSINDEEEENWL